MSQHPLFRDEQSNDPDPKYVRHSATSKAAADAIRGALAAKQRREVMDAIRAAGDRGMTDLEIAAVLGIGGSSGRPRRIELHRMGLVADSGRTRETPSGRQAVVWIAAEVAAGKESAHA